MKCVVVFLTSCLLWNFTNSQSCQTPLGRPSECISLYDCPTLLAAFEDRPLLSQYIGFLRQSQCGFDGFTPRVCCGPLPRQPDRQHTTTTSRPVWPSPVEEEPASQGDQSSNDDASPARECGVDRSDRIYGGQITDLDEFPWMALLGYRTRSGNLTYQCGGVLINRRYVLTAAHCVTGEIESAVGKLATVRLGEYDVQQDVDCLDGLCADRPQEIPVQGAYAHPGFSDKNTNRQDDIAIIRLTRRVRLNDYVKPICLVDNRMRLDTGNSVYVAGWGKTLNGKSSPVKLKLSLPVFNKNECVSKYRPLGAALTDKQICAGGNFAQDTCRGLGGSHATPV
ncbi:trypsin domain-containing protein [Phthorimaea operculella]|nr:trypsin domain-containing protein [Phthorimaea operculella]